MKRILLFGILLFFQNCIQFKVDILKPDLIAKLTIGLAPTEVNGIVTNNVLSNIPFYVPQRGGLFYVVDNLHQSIKAFDSQGNLEFVIGNFDFELPTSVKQVRYRFGNIGHIAVDSDGNLYIQNRFGKKDDLTLLSKEEDLFKKFSGSFDPSPGSPLPSYILWMNKKGDLLSLLGTKGKNSEPFRIIESLLATKDNRLFVYHKFLEEFRLSYFQNGELVSEIQETKLPIFKTEESKEYKIYLDKIHPHPEGKYAIASVSFHQKQDNRFKFRRLYRLSFSDLDSYQLLKEIQDPKEYLFSIQDNGEFYIWETEEEGLSIKLQVHDQEGNHINNKRIPIDPPRSQWREIYTDGYDNIYSLRIRSGFIEVYRWK